ncbi:small acid-soluble spore protein Tlp [Jeotgalibacillus sp. ET6]|uniref:small acid-soluble spore protein Tlp n=1 Tax=Jeotgalibacillus sp. ET6 TaxID=3037260 RepID=UPI002418A2F0|nr:small acid-soluble spore protein Tlp [Jeotgalibacillus sp. ET6]MDG5472632.1 small acid-soluble spore protein Tlp [Jeotgalibacillus sp. ET6]
MTQNKPNPDNRADNAEKLKEMVQNTIGNMEAAEETMAFADGKDKKAIEEKNKRRQDSIDAMRNEIKDESRQ